MITRKGTTIFLRPPSDSQPTREPRAVGVGLAAAASVGLFGGGVGTGSSDPFGLRGYFNDCQDAT